MKFIVDHRLLDYKVGFSAHSWHLNKLCLCKHFVLELIECGSLEASIQCSVRSCKIKCLRYNLSNLSSRELSDMEIYASQRTTET